MPAKINIPLGAKFHRLTVLARAEGIFWQCQCDCGAILLISGSHLRKGHTKSCGCIKLKHGMWRSAEFGVWQCMKNRCYNEAHEMYSYYGGNGIKVCPRWLESFVNFYADMGPRPTAKHSIERKNGKGDYCPENCKWGTKKEQMRNRSDNVYLTLNGITKLAIEWAEEMGWYVDVFYQRKKMGWSDEDILTRPLRITKRSR